MTTSINLAVEAYFRLPEDLADFSVDGVLSEEPAEFRFGSDTRCFARLRENIAARTRGEYDALADAEFHGLQVRLPFDVAEAAENLRCERFPIAKQRPSVVRTAVRRAYYGIRPLLPVAVRKHLQRRTLRGWESKPFPSWPVDRTVDRLFEKLMGLLIAGRGGESVPFIWFWPDGKQGCVVMTHDVETSAGLNYCERLMDVNSSFEIPSSFQLIPGGRYEVGQSLLAEIRSRGFEVNVHDWNHDGWLFRDRNLYLERVARINEVAATWGALGFRSAALYRNPEWFDALDFEYDMSLPNVAHLDPQPGGCCTIMPFFIGKLLEIPVTVTQDYSLFHILKTNSIELWMRQTGTILEGNGIANFIVHPDYVIEARVAATYRRLLQHICQLRMERNAWVTLPRSVNQWWRDRSQMKLIRNSNGWQITGPSSKRACVAYAQLVDDALVYTLEESKTTQYEGHTCAASAES